MDNTILLIGAGILLWHLAQQKEAMPTTDPIKPLPPEHQQMNGYYPSNFKGHRPIYPFQARWAGFNYSDTSKKARMVV